MCTKHRSQWCFVHIKSDTRTHENTTLLGTRSDDAPEQPGVTFGSFSASPGLLLGSLWARWAAPWPLLGVSWALLVCLLGALGCLLAGLERPLGAGWLSGAPRALISNGFCSVQGAFGMSSRWAWTRSRHTRSHTHFGIPSSWSISRHWSRPCFVDSSLFIYQVFLSFLLCQK